MNDIRLARDRDAWGTIRGFVYQVQLTIDHWLRLEEHEILELERGEDIDIVSDVLFCSDEEQKRTLGQVKHRVNNLTLRSHEAIEAMSLFHEHRLLNPNKKLKFRFITNANITVERPSPFPNKSPAIQIWVELKEVTLQNQDEIKKLRILRGLLSTTIKPKSLDNELWDQWIYFVKYCDDDELFDFVKSFEWGTKQVSFDEMDNIIIEELKKRYITELDHPLDKAKRMYERMFLFVFKLLSKKGLKQLSKADIIKNINISELNTEDIILIDKLNKLFRELESRVYSIEQTVDFHQFSIDMLDEKVNDLKTEFHFQANVSLVNDIPIIDIPALNNSLNRTKTVEDILQHLRNTTWVSIFGDIGRGKSNLAVQISEKLGNCYAWIRFREMNSDQASKRIDMVMSHLSNSPVDYNRSIWYEKVCSTFPKGSILVLDDIPRLSVNGSLEESITLLVNASNKYGLKILSTSNHRLPGLIKDNLVSKIIEIEVPKFTDLEIIDLFLARQAPQLFLDNGDFINMIAILTKRHPLLLTAAVKYLEDENWNINQTALDALFHGQYADEVNDLIQDVILKKLVDSDTRELLYRLTLINGSFGATQIREVSLVLPIISNAYERVNKALGLWMQKDTISTFLVSPLLSQLGNLNLDINIKKQVHKVLGRSILRKKVIDPSEALTAITHFSSAEAHNEVAMILMTVLVEMENLEIDSDPWGFTLIWTDRRFPKGIQYHLSLALRVKQISLNKKLGKDISFLIDDFDLLLKEGSAEDSFVAALQIYMGSIIGLINPIKGNEYLVNGLKKMKNRTDFFDKTQINPLEFQPESLIWLTGSAIQTYEQLQNWLSTIRMFSSEQQKAVFESSLAADSCMHVCDQIWMREQGKSEIYKNWDQILTQLDEVSAFAKDLNLPLLWACSIRGKIIVYGEYKKNLADALNIAEDSLAQVSKEPEIQFIIREVMGRQFVYNKSFSEAIQWLTTALKVPIDKYPNERIFAMLELSNALGETDPHLAAYFSGQAVKVARESDSVSEEWTIKALGEHIISTWLNDNISSVYEDVQEAVKLLLAVDKTQNNWKKLFVIFGHLSGYIVSIICTGLPPSKTSDGEPYAEPKRGLFLKNLPLELSGLYNPARDYMLAEHVALLSENKGDYGQAAKWSIHAFDMALDRNDREAVRLIGTSTIPYLIMTNRFAEALDVALETEVVFELLRKNQPITQEASKIIGVKPNETWNTIEQSAAEVLLIPSVMSILMTQKNDPQTSDLLALELISLCHQMEVGASMPKLWVSLSKAIDEIYNRKLDYVNFIEKGNSNTMYPVLQILYYIGASLVGSQEQALFGYMAINPFIKRKFEQREVIFNQIIEPFIKEFWILI